VGTVTVASDPSGHFLFVLLTNIIGQSLTVTVNVNTGAITINGPANWINMSGMYNASTGAFTTTGSGTAAGRSGVQATYVGAITQAGVMSGVSTMGLNGTLPNNPIAQQVNAQKQ
jgi:hypothetical protein